MRLAQQVVEYGADGLGRVAVLPQSRRDVLAERCILRLGVVGGEAGRVEGFDRLVAASVGLGDTK